MRNLSFALTAVNIDEQAVRKRSRSYRGRVIRLNDDATHRYWSEAIYDLIRAGKILASVRSSTHIWLLLACPLAKLGNSAIRENAQDALGEEWKVLAQLFFQEDLRNISPHGHVSYVGTLHIGVDDSWQIGAPRLKMLEVRLVPLQSPCWLIRMRSVAYDRSVERADKNSRCFAVCSDEDESYLRPTPKAEIVDQLAYVSMRATSDRVPWKAKAASNLKQIDKFGLLCLLLSQLSNSMGMSLPGVTVEPLNAHRPIGSKTQAKKELMHEHVIGQVARALAGYRVDVYDHAGKPEYMAGLMRTMFPFIEWCVAREVCAQETRPKHLLAVVNTPRDNDPEPDDVKSWLRQQKFIVLQCVTDATVALVSKSIVRREAKVRADLERGVIETRRPPQEHEVIARGLLMQLLVKIELSLRKFIVPRPWMGAVAVQQYAFVYREYGDSKWVAVLPLNEYEFEVLVVDNARRLRLGSRIPVIVDPPEVGKDERGKVCETIRASSRRCVVIRNSEINAYSTERKGHAGLWIIPEFNGYISLGSDAASSDLATKVAPRLRIVETYEYGLAASPELCRESLLDMASLAYDPTVRLFKTSAYPIYVKVAAEAMEAMN